MWSCSFWASMSISQPVYLHHWPSAISRVYRERSLNVFPRRNISRRSGENGRTGSRWQMTPDKQTAGLALKQTGSRSGGRRLRLKKVFQFCVECIPRGLMASLKTAEQLCVPDDVSGGCKLFQRCFVWYMTSGPNKPILMRFFLLVLDYPSILQQDTWKCIFGELKGL